MKKIYIILYILVLLLPIVRAEDSFGTFKVNAPIRLIQTCPTCTYVNITSITSPTSEILLSNVNMTKQGGLFMYDLAGQTKKGTYITCGFGDLDGADTSWCYTFEVNDTGQALSVAYMIAVFSLILLYLGLMMLGFSFGNFTFASFGFFIGIVLGILLGAIHIFLVILFMLINVIAFIQFSRTHHK